ncbi:MAG: AAC(3) family N-acetyltransferase [Rhodospirillaceae bacterium]|nr:AAC(3) family N-acetyltransferase [Rhodospirillaceae bacterium]
MAAASDYSQADLERALRQAGIVAGDAALVHVSMGRLGRPAEGMSMDVMNRICLDAFRNVLGPAGTLFIPTYTYSLGKGDVYDPATTPSTVGAFTEFFRLLPDVVRSRDPMLATAGLGPRAAELLQGVAPSCYGRGSFFDRFNGSGGKVCTLGIDLHWATFRHHIEEMAGVPFRRPKKFKGKILVGGAVQEEEWTYFAAPFLPNCEPNGQPLATAIKTAGLAKEAPVGRSSVIAVGAKDYFDYAMAALKRDPWFTAKGPACSEAEIAAAMSK